RVGKPALAEVKLIGLNRDPRRTHLFTIQPDLGLQDTFKTDLVIIPAVHGDAEKVLEDNKDFVPWIIKQYRNGAEVVSLCIGAFILASTGLLKGKSCTTHWLMADNFKSMFPRSEEHTSELQSRENLVCRLLLEKKNNYI